MNFVRDITLGQYFAADSVIHRLDPRTKLLSLLAVMTFLVITIRPAVYALFVVLLILIILLARLPGGLVFRNLRPFLWLFLITFFLNLFHAEGRILWRMPVTGWEITGMGLQRAAVYSVRIALLIVFAAVFTLTTSPMDITDGLIRLLAPLKRLRVPVQEFALMMTIAIRFIPLLLEEADRIQKAQMARGARFEGSLLQRIRSLVPLVVPLFVSAFRKADDLALAMEARGYRIGKERTSYAVLAFRREDYLALGVTALLGLLVWRLA